MLPDDEYEQAWYYRMTGTNRPGYCRMTCKSFKMVGFTPTIYFL